MEFKTLLQLLEKSFGTANFDTKAAAVALTSGINQTTAPNLLTQELSRSLLKTYSNDLNRLYRMRFLKRKRVKRQVITRTGKRCNRGVAYVFSIGRQGHSYCKWLRTDPQSRSARSKGKFIDRILIESLRNRLPVDEAPFAEKIYCGLIPSAITKSVHMRFPERYIDPAFTFLLQKRNKENREMKKMYDDEVIHNMREQIDDISRQRYHDEVKQQISDFWKTLAEHKASGALTIPLKPAS